MTTVQTPDLRSRPNARVDILINPEKRVGQRIHFKAGSRGFSLLALRVERRIGSAASTATLSILDQSGFHRHLEWNQRIRIRLDGGIVFGGFITDIERDLDGPIGVHVNLQCQGLDRILYSIPIIGSAGYTNEETGDIVADLFATYAATRLQEGSITATAANTPIAAPSATFDIAEGESLGEVLERLAAIDGFSFWVEDTEDDEEYPNVLRPLLHYDIPADADEHDPPIYEQDIREGSTYQVGVLPPITAIRLQETDGTEHFIANARTEVHTAFSQEFLGNVRVDDNSRFDTAGGVVDVTGERIRYSDVGSDATSDYLVVTERGVDETRAVNHVAGEVVLGEEAATYGLWIHSDSIPTDENATEVAEVFLAERSEPAERLSLPLRNVRTDLTPFAPVRVVRPRLGIDKTYAITSVSHELLADGGLATTVEAGTREFNMARALALLRKEV